MEKIHIDVRESTDQRGVPCSLASLAGRDIAAEGSTPEEAVHRLADYMLELTEQGYSLVRGAS